MKVLAGITSKFGTSYRELSLRRVKSYVVESAMDTDTDSWSLDLGNPDNLLTDLLSRDSEVRVRIIGGGSVKGVTALHTGFADIVGITQDNTIAMSGRDVSAVAVDSIILPADFKHARPHKLIEKQGRELGITSFNLKPVAQFNKIYTPGSETYWEFWYRMYRKKQMWLWAGPAGTLHAQALNYTEKPRYYLGVPPKDSSNPKQYISIKSIEIRKNTQSRVGEIVVFGERGDDVGFVVKANDATIRQWIKRPRKIVESAEAVNKNEARKEAYEEIFEGKVGSIEITVTIADPGYIIQQNTVARLNLPQIGYGGTFFVVGTRLLGGAEGFVQEIRLRERQYALTRRVPTDPKLAEESKDKEFTAYSANILSDRPGWAGYFLLAAKEWHGQYDERLFLATLMAICQKETGFRNVREIGSDGSGGVEWYDPRLAPNRNTTGEERAEGTTVGSAGGVNTRSDHTRHFANEAENSLNPFGREAGVGPMQLTTRSFKEDADAHHGVKDEYVGGRWHPASNIYIGAKVLHGKLQGFPPTTAGFWAGVKAYNGAGPRAEAYMQSVKKSVESEWLPQVEIAAEAAAEDGGQMSTIPGFNIDHLVRVPDAIGQAGSCGVPGGPKGWPHVYPGISETAFTLARRFGLKIASGYRDPICNKKVGGADNSDHLCGAGVDFVGPPARMAALALHAEGTGDYAMVIYGPLKIGPQNAWEGHYDHVHISFIRCADIGKRPPGSHPTTTREGPAE